MDELSYELRYFWEDKQAHEPSQSEPPHGGIEPNPREE